MKIIILFTALILAIPVMAQEDCTDIYRKVDDFTGKILMYSPVLKPATIYKTINKGKAVYQLNLRAYGNTAVVNGKGVIILFEDDTKWSKQIKVSIDVDGGKFEYSTFFILTESDILLISTKKIKKFRLDIFDEILDSGEAEKFVSYVNCIKNMK